jgi:hypothetical protein
MLWKFITHYQKAMFWTRIKGIGYLRMPSILSYPHVGNFMKRFLAKGFLIALLNMGQMCLIFEVKKHISHMKHKVLEVLMPFITFLHAIDI